jgi:GNAT superfamily N-acetyltransferase
MRKQQSASKAGGGAVHCVEATPDRWADLETLFGKPGACGECWCMYWRLAPKDWTAGKEGGNRTALAALVSSGPPPGILAYDGGTPVGWCAVSPRSAFPRLDRSKNLAPVDELPVWSIVCFFIAKPNRRQGVSEQLIRGAIEIARRHGAIALEAYPVVPQEAEMPDAFAWTGILSSFQKLGFQEVARRSVNRPIVRLMLGSTAVM